MKINAHFGKKWLKIGCFWCIFGLSDVKNRIFGKKKHEKPLPCEKFTLTLQPKI